MQINLFERKSKLESDVFIELLTYDLFGSVFFNHVNSVKGGFISKLKQILFLLITVVFLSVSLVIVYPYIVI
ncbi:MAG: hypothetical protein FJX84_08975 [Bacteroidetes bacterium]|nr:hypothetical protein [Bacteroidota bacterium]